MSSNPTSETIILNTVLENSMDESEDQSYEISLRILGNEIVGVKLSTTSTSSRWMTVAVLTIFSSLVLLGAYGEKLANVYHWFMK